MNLSRCAILFLTVAVIASHADETNLTLTVDGVTYSNVTFGTVTPSSVSIRHSVGIARVPLAKLPPELQKQFGYDPQKAAEWQKVENQKAAEREKAEQQTRLREEQYAKYQADNRFLLDGILVDAGKVTEMHGTIVATPTSVKGNDGRTYKGTLFQGTTVSGYEVENVSAFEGESSAIAIPKLATVNFFVKDFLPANSIGSSVSFRGALINPIGGYTAWAVARKPSYEEWQKFQKQP